MSRLGFAIAAFAFSVGGCGHTDVYQAILRPPSPSRGVLPELYVAPSVPSRPFQDVAILQAIGSGRDANPGELAKALTARGAALGCDAIVQVAFDEGSLIAHASGVCVRWTAPAPDPDAPQGS